MTTINRKELYKKVWEAPITRLSKEYGLSDVGFAKICRKHNIPRPPRGYWARKAAGYRVKRIPFLRQQTGERKDRAPAVGRAALPALIHVPHGERVSNLRAPPSYRGEAESVDGSDDKGEAVVGYCDSLVTTIHPLILINAGG